MYPPTVGDTARIMEWVAMLRPKDVPVSDSDTLLVMVLLAMVLRRAPDITMGIMTKHSKLRLLAKLCSITHTAVIDDPL